MEFLICQETLIKSQNQCFHNFESYFVVSSLTTLAPIIFRE